jgi:hypothetical protein
MTATEEHIIFIDNLSSVLGGNNGDEGDDDEFSVGSSNVAPAEAPAAISSSSSSGRRQQQPRWNGNSSNRRRRRNVVTDNESVDTTLLASSVGSVVGPTRNAFLRCLVFYDDSDFADSSGDGVDNQEAVRQFDVSFSDGLEELEEDQSGKNKFLLKSLRRSNSKPVTVSSMSPQLEKVCKLQVGDAVTKVNKKTIGPSFNANRVSNLWHKSVASKHGHIRSIQTGNDAGMDTILQVTLIKPHPDATADELGLGVWWWRGLCVRFVSPDTLASFTPLKVDDELESVNDILLEDVKSPEAFETIVKTFPVEITLVVKRGKPRWNGHFN